MRLDAALRVDATCDTFSVSGMGGSPASITLTHGVYLPDALADEMESQLQSAVDPGIGVSFVSGVLTVTWSSGVGAITWSSNPRLRDYLGCTGSLLGSSGSATADGPCAGIFLASLPWSAPSPLSWRLDVARAPTWRGGGKGILRALHRVWSVTARATPDELPALRRVLGTLLAGLPGRLHMDVDNPDPWSASDPYGYADVYLAQDGRQYVDRWFTLPSRLACEIDLEFAEVPT